jgi:carboxyl-terminal processing protease
MKTSRIEHAALRIALALAVVLPTAAHAAQTDAPGANPPDLKWTVQDAKAAHVTAQVLARFHYKPTPLDETLSAKVFDQYLKSLDSEKLLFVQDDIDRLSVHRTRLGEGIMKEDLGVPFAMFNLYRQRAVERFSYARSLLKKGFDFHANEHYQFAREKEAWAKSEAEMRELWRKRLKNDWLRLKLGGKDDKSIVELLDKRYDTLMRQVLRIKSADAFQTFMNAYTMAVEPHTTYLGPRASAEFGISMQLSLVGIGASLTELNDFITIRELVPGGPALLSGLLKVGDRIVGVGRRRAG